MLTSALGSAVTPKIHSRGNSEFVSLVAVGCGQLCFLKEGRLPGAQELKSVSLTIA